MIKQKNEFNSQHRLLQGTCYDCDYSIGYVNHVNLKELLNFHKPTSAKVF